MTALANENGAVPPQDDANDALALSMVGDEWDGAVESEKIQSTAERFSSRPCDFDDPEYRRQAAQAKETRLTEARKAAMESGDWDAFEAVSAELDGDDTDVPYAERGLNTRYGVREPWLLHGLPTKRHWLSHDDRAAYEHRLEVSDALYGAGWPFAHERLLFKEFTARDREHWTSWRPFKVSENVDYGKLAAVLAQKTEEVGATAALAYVENLVDEGQPGIVDRRKEARFHTTLDLVAGSHNDHWFFAHPFCRECFPSDYLTVDGHYAAWLLKQRTDNAYPSCEWDGLVPPMPVLPDEITFLTDEDLDQRPETGWLIDAILPDSGTGILRARDQSFKSFMALSWALDVVTEGRKVLYCVGEGVDQFSRRRDAWLEHNEYEVEDLEGNLHYADRVPNLFTGDAAFEAVLARCRLEQYDLVIIDTYARAAAGSDINSQGDQSIVTGRVDEIKRATGGTVLLVAHSQKSDTDSSGSIEIEDARDFVFSMRRNGTEGRVTFEVTKQKDGVESPRPVEYVTRQIGASMVLVEAGEAGVSIMTTNDWIVAALDSTRGLGGQTESQIRSWINSHDQRDKLMTNSTCSSALSRMVTDGRVAKAGTRYSLQESS
jgi:hypothetical protein